MPGFGSATSESTGSASTTAWGRTGRSRPPSIERSGWKPRSASDRSRCVMTDRTPARVVTGLVFVLFGCALLLATVDVVSLRWDWVGPLLVMGAGAAILAGAAVRLRRRDG